MCNSKVAFKINFLLTNKESSQTSMKTTLDPLKVEKTAERIETYSEMEEQIMKVPELGPVRYPILLVLVDFQD
jgi:hypothetical protein